MRSNNFTSIFQRRHAVKAHQTSGSGVGPAAAVAAVAAAEANRIAIGHCDIINRAASAER